MMGLILEKRQQKEEDFINGKEIQQLLNPLVFTMIMQMLELKDRFLEVQILGWMLQ